MKIKVRLSNLLRQAAGWKEVVEVDGSTPRECIERLEHMFPEIRRWIYDKDGRMWDRLQLFVNRQMISKDKLDQQLKSDDELYLLLNIGGG